MPGMPGSFSALCVPVTEKTYVARIRSPRSVATVHSESVSSQRSSVARVRKQASTVQIEVLCDGPRVLPDLLAGGVLPLRDVSDLFEQRHVDVRLDVAVDAGVPVPVPGAAEIPALFDDPDPLHARLPQPRAGEQPAEAAADDEHVDAVVERLAAESGLRVRIGGVAGELAAGRTVLAAAVGADAAGPLDAVALAQCLGVEAGFGLEIVVVAGGVGVGGHGSPPCRQRPCPGSVTGRWIRVLAHPQTNISDSRLSLVRMSILLGS